MSETWAALKTRCPYCGVAPYRWCRTHRDMLTDRLHKMRTDAAMRADIAAAKHVTAEIEPEESK